MKKYHIKCHFPGNYFYARTIKITLGEQAIRIAPGQEKSISLIDEPVKLQARIDMYKSVLDLSPSEKDERFFILRYKGETPAQRVWASFTRGAIQLLEVDQSTYEAFSPEVYTTYPRASGNLDAVSLLTTLMLAIFFGYQSLRESHTGLSEFLISVSVLGLITVATVFFDRKNMAINDASLRIALANLCFLVAVIWSSVLGQSGTWILWLVVIVPLFRSIPQVFRSVDFYSKLDKLQK